LAQGGTGENREWENWPGRKPPDDRIRGRLKSLFAATDDPDAVDSLISDRSREIEEQTERLQLTIENLEQREEQAARLRAAVEEMLRHGSAELDERHAALTALAADLGAREGRLREQEHELALRRQELGAVELRRAAVERREEAAARREAALTHTHGRNEPEHAEQRAGEPDPAAGHVLVLADGGWRMIERDGPPPVVDSSLEIDGQAFLVTRVGRSTLPGDRRACVYLEPARTVA
jgi:DNA repair exonuclease SbcCD ATPase subunit